jgi:hypothetical protein
VVNFEPAPLAFLALPLSQPDPWAAAVLVDEVDAGGFECRPNLSSRAFSTAKLAFQSL